MQHASELAFESGGYFSEPFKQNRGATVWSPRAKPQGMERGRQQAGIAQQPRLERRSTLPKTLPPISPAWLTQALAELNGIDDEVAEEGLPEVSRAVTEEARRILRDLGGVPVAPMVYSTMDGEIAIDFRSSTNTVHAVLIELGDDGGGACFALINGKSRRARYSDSSDLPDEFAHAQLRALAKPA